MDEFFLYDSPKNRANILTVCHFSKISAAEAPAFASFLMESVKSRFGRSIDEQGNGFPRMSCKMVKILGEFYFK